VLNHCHFGASDAFVEQNFHEVGAADGFGLHAKATRVFPRQFQVVIKDTVLQVVEARVIHNTSEIEIESGLRAMLRRILPRTAIVALAVAAVVLVFGRRYYSSSTDLALNYSLARNIAEGLAWPHAEDYLGEMGFYPPVAHILAAIVGGLLGSTIVGVTSTALVAVFGIYLVLLCMMRFKTTLATLSAFGLFFCAAIFLSRGNHLFGGEIVHNFFFAQVVSVSLSLVAFYSVSLFSGPLQQALIGLCATALLGWVYPLAQVYLATSCFSLIALNGLKEFLLFRSIKSPTIAALILLCIGLPLAIVQHPKFAIMSKIAQYNAGDGVFPGSLATAPIMGCATALLVVAAVLFVLDLQRRLDLENPVRFIALGVAVASSGILQWLVLLLTGKGSDYGIAKHSFGIVTLLAAAIAVLFVSLLRSSKSVSNTSVYSPSQLWLVIVTGFCLMFVVLPRSAGRHPMKLLRADIDFAQHVLRHTLPPDAIGASVVIDPRLTTAEQLAISMGDFRFPKFSAIPFYLSQVRFGIPQSLWDGYVAYLKAHPIKYAIVWSEGEPTPAPSCILERSAIASLVLIDYSCYEEKGPAYKLETWVHLNRLLRAKAFLGNGWSTVEPWGVWSSGREASINFALETEHGSSSDLMLEVNVAANITAEHLKQRVEISANGQDVGSWAITTAAPTKYELRIPRSAVTGSRLEIHFVLPDAVAGGPGDPRELAIGLIDFRLRAG
jgi:hypothetical protein